MNFRGRTILIAVLLAVIGYAILAACLPPPGQHPLLAPPNPNGNPGMAAEQQYLLRLMAGTIAVMGALIGGLFRITMPGIWRRDSIVAVAAFLVGIAFLAIGLSLRNIWHITQAGLPAAVVSLDLYFSGPVTALAYIVAAGALAKTVYDYWLESRPAAGSVPVPHAS